MNIRKASLQDLAHFKKLGNIQLNRSHAILHYKDINRYCYADIVNYTNSGVYILIARLLDEITGLSFIQFTDPNVDIYIIVNDIAIPKLRVSYFESYELFTPQAVIDNVINNYNADYVHVH